MIADSHTEVEMSASRRQQKVLLFYITHSPKQQKSNWPQQSSLTVTQETQRKSQSETERENARTRAKVCGRTGGRKERDETRMKKEGMVGYG